MKIKISPRVLVMAISVIIAHTSTIVKATTIRELNEAYYACLKNKTHDKCLDEHRAAFDEHGCHSTDGSDPQGHRYTVDTPCSR
jgi:hypothetical protein